MALLARFCKKIDQRFPASDEYEFKQSLEPSLACPIYVAAVVSLASSFWSQWSLGIDIDYADPLLLFRACKNMFMALLAISIVISVALRGWIARRLCPINLEFLVVVVCIMGMTLNIIAASWYSAQLFGRDPIQTFGTEVGSAEINICLLTTIITTFCCLVMPIRTHLSCPLAIWGICIFYASTLATSSPYPGNIPYLMCCLCCVSGFSVFGGYRNESHIRNEWLGQRKIEKTTDVSEKQRQAFSHLLNRMCDCLLHLGSDFEITNPCPNLAAMLFRTNGKPLQGSRFCDCLASEDDCERFVAALRSDISQAESSGIVPLHLRDAHSREVPVHIYYTSFYDQDGSPYHIIGVVESGGHAHVEGPVEEVGVLYDAQQMRGRRPDKESSGSQSELTLESVSGADLGEVVVTIQDDRELSVMSCTPAFTSLFGPIADNAQLRDCIVGVDSFVSRVQSCVRGFLELQDLGDLVLRTPTSTRAGIEYVVGGCYVEAVHASPDTVNENYQTCTIRLRLDHIQQHSLPKTSRTKRRAAPTSMSNMSPRDTQMCQL